MEERLHTFEQKSKIDERTIKSLQDKLNEVSNQNQRLLSQYAMNEEVNIVCWHYHNYTHKMILPSSSLPH